jgi:hypothetical protein
MRKTLLPLVLAASVVGCAAPDPTTRFAVEGVESWWAVGTAQGDTQFVSPVVRFRLKNITTGESRSIQAQAIFRRTGEQQNWGSDWREVASANAPIAAGAAVPVELRSDGRLNGTGSPESLLAHDQFKDVTATIFLREGSSMFRTSTWTKATEVQVERRIGPPEAVAAAAAAAAAAATPAPEASPSAAPSPVRPTNDR